jgi:hypothetical protein
MPQPGCQGHHEDAPADPGIHVAGIGSRRKPMVEKISEGTVTGESKDEPQREQR